MTVFGKRILSFAVVGSLCATAVPAIAILLFPVSQCAYL